MKFSALNSVGYGRLDLLCFCALKDIILWAIQPDMTKFEGNASYIETNDVKILIQIILE